MKLVNKFFILMILLTIFFSIGAVFSADLEDGNMTQAVSTSSDDADFFKSTDDLSSISINEDSKYSSESNEIDVENWDDLQYYSSLADKNYVLKLKENTNYYPTDVSSSDSQIIFNNNVTIIGAEGAYIGDSSPDARNITYVAMKVPDNSGIGITLKGVTFKWISTRYQPDGVFFVMGGNANNYIEDCYFNNISTNLGHSSILHIKLGDAYVSNCTFVNCTTDFGCLSVYNPDDDPTKTCVLARMEVTDSYFEGNYARTEPGCINNCGILVVRNTTFYKNSAFWWAGAIHTHGGANTTIYDSNFTDNVAGWNGGALYTYSYLQIYNSIFVGNNCTTNNGGGAIGACKYLHAPYIIIEDSLFKDNENTCWGLDELSTTGTGRGGAISIMDEGALVVRNSDFIHNSASMGTAICAINGGNIQGSPDVIIVGNRFINHTRVGDVLDIRLATSSYLEIRDNYYYNNSFEFKKLRLLAGEKIGNEAIVQIDAELKNPDSFESDILDTTEYDIYVNDVYNKTIVGRTFSIPLQDGETCYVYAVPYISDSITNKISVGKPKEYIYVSKTGNDANDGLTRTSPVATVAKAIELATEKGNIIIMSGTYNEYNLTVDYNLSIVGEGNVKFSGNVPLAVQTIFKVTNNSDVGLSGITFDSIVLKADTTNKNKRVILQDSGYLTIDNCVFNKISANGNTGMTIIEAPNIEIYNSKFTNNNQIQITAISSDDFLVDNCTFTGTKSGQSNYPSVIKTMTSTKSGIKGVITDSTFEGNTVYYGCVYFGASSAPLTITNTKFIGNTAASTSAHATAVKIETSPVARFDSCVFMDNVNIGTRAALIYAASSSASVYVTNSIILNNSYANSNKMLFSASTASNLKVYKNLNGNWWGNTLENKTVAPAAYASACNNWIVLNITANTTELGTNQKALVDFNFNNVYDKEFNDSFYDARGFPSFDLAIATTGGSSNVNKVSVVDGRASAIYTLQSNSGTLTASYKNIQSTIDFTWSLVNPEIEIDVENITYGEDAIINLILPSDISLNDISLTLDQNSLTAQNTITVHDLDAGEHTLTLNYNGNSKYNPINLVKTFNVGKANPELTISVNSEYYYGNAISLTVNTNKDVTGSISIKVGDLTQNKAISNGKAVFTLSNLAANNYTVLATYSGNTNFVSGSASSNFEVKKYNSAISISNTAATAGSNVVLTFNVNSDATGTVTVSINGENHNVNVANGKATYTINSISRGLYNIEATYNGDAKYLPSSNNITLDVSRLNPNLAATVSNINYGQDEVIQITLVNAATGSVTVTVDGISQTVNVSNGKATATISGLTVGSKNALISYSGDDTYKPTNLTKSFSVAKSQPIISIVAPNIKEGQVATIQFTISQGATGTLVLNYAGKSENANIPRTGLLTRTLSDLAVGNYPITVSYSGDSNYLSASASGSFTVKAWDKPQWPNEGYDVANSGNSPYASETNGNIEWIASVDGEIIGNMIIDSVGNIYITTSNGIYSYDNTGKQIWNFNSQDAGESFSGIAVGRDVVVSPKSGDKLYFINQTTGQKYNNNIYQGSSIFVPVIDDNANIYITSEYQFSSSSYNLVIVPYNIWQSSTAPKLINLGQHEPTSAPVIVNDEYVAIATVDGLLIVDLSSESIISIYDDVITNVRPVAADGYIYAVSNYGLILCVDPVSGVEWVSEITGTPGDNIIVNGDMVYSINKQGVLYQYFYGEETPLFNFNETVSSGILLGNDGTLYVGTESGVFYAINENGELVWKVSLGNSISGSPIMDNNGVIYTVVGGKIYALSYAELKNPQLSGNINNVFYGDDVIVNIEVDSEATGIVSITVGNENYESELNNGKASFTLTDLDAGTYTANIYYGGDARYEQDSLDIQFKVNKANVNMTIKDSNIKVGENLVVVVSNLPAYATGTLTISVNGKTNRATVINGGATLTVPGLSKGDYTYTVTYSGDDNYNQATESRQIFVGYVETTFRASTSDISVGQTAAVSVTGLPSDASGVTYVTLNNQNYSAAVRNGASKISIPNLSYGTYNLNVRYANDTKYMANPYDIVLHVNKVNPTITINANNINVGSALPVTVNLNNDASGSVLITVGDVTNNVTVSKGVASTSISGLSAGNYNVAVIYSGDAKYNAITSSKSIKVSKNTPTMTISANNINVGTPLEVKVNLNNDASGSVLITVGDISENVAIVNGIASTSITRLNSGNYTITTSYSGDDKYNARTATKAIKVSKINVKISLEYDDEIFEGQNVTVTVSSLPDDGSCIVKLIGDISNDIEVVDGVAKYVISGLTAGEYSFNVFYPGNDKYNVDTVSDNKIVVKAKEKVILRASNVVMEYHDGTVYSVKLTDYDGNSIENAVIKFAVNGNVYSYVTDANGIANLPITLGIGVYGVNATFEGNTSHESSTVSNTITVNLINIILNASDVNMTYKDGTNYAIKVSDTRGNPISGITLDVNNTLGVYHYKTNSNGIATANLAKLMPGTYVISATFNGSDIYASGSIENTVTVNKIDVNLAASDVSMNYGDGTNYQILVTDVYGNVISGVYVDVNNTLGIYHYKTNSKGIATANLARLKEGSYVISATFNETDIYNSAYITNNVVVHDPNKKISADIVIDADNVAYGEDLVVNIKLPSDVKYRANVTVGNYSKLASLRSGEGTVKFSGLSIGTYNVLVTYVGDVNYLKSSNSTSVKVTKAVPNIIISAPSVTLGEDLVVSVEMPSDVKYRAMVTIGDESKYVSFKDGKGSVKFSGLEMGTYRIKASYGGDANYFSSSVAISAKVNRPLVPINVITEDINCGEDLVVSVEMPSDVKYRAMVTIGDESKYVSFKDGKGSVKFSGLAIGTYNVVVSYDGDVNYYKTSVTKTVKVNKGLANINITANDVPYGEDLVVSVEMPSDVKYRAMVTIGDESKYVSFKDGKGSVKFSGLEMGTYTITASYVGDSNYLKSEASVSAKVTKAIPQIQVTANDIKYGESLNVDVKLPSDVTRRAVVTIDGVSKYVSIKAGVGSIKFDGLAVGTHDVVVSYGGDSIYASSSITTKINVKL